MGELFDYVMRTPGNTNPAVLSSEIQKLIDENIVQPDWNQRDSKAKDYIKNKPGGYGYEYSGSNGTEIDLTTITSGVYKVAQWNEAYVSSGSQELLNSLVGYSALKKTSISNRYYHPMGRVLWAREGAKPFRLESTLIFRDPVSSNPAWDCTPLDENNYIIAHSWWHKIPLYLIVDLNTLSQELRADFLTRGLYIKVPEDYECPNLTQFPIQTVYFSTYYDQPISNQYIGNKVQPKAIFDEKNYFSTKTVEGALDQIGGQLSSKELILDSSTADSTKKFKLTVDDTGTVTATEINET